MLEGKATTQEAEEYTDNQEAIMAEAPTGRWVPLLFLGDSYTRCHNKSTVQNFGKCEFQPSIPFVRFLQDTECNIFIVYCILTLAPVAKKRSGKRPWQPQRAQDDTDHEDEEAVDEVDEEEDDEDGEEQGVYAGEEEGDPFLADDDGAEDEDEDALFEGSEDDEERAMREAERERLRKLYLDAAKENPDPAHEKIMEVTMPECLAYL